MTTKIKSEIISVTPEMAKEFLNYNEQNRRIRQGWINYLAYLILHDEWKVTHQGLAFSDLGRMLDGQHRCHAIVKANKPVPVMISYGWDESVFSAIDCGIKRTDADLTHLPRRLVECAKLLINVMQFEGFDMPANKKLYGKCTPAQICEYSEIIKEYFDVLEKKCSTCTTVFSTVPGRCAVIANLMNGEDMDYVLDLYRDLILVKSENLPPIARSALSQYVTGFLNTKGGGTVRIDNFCRIFPIYKKANKNIQKLILRNRQDRLDEIRTSLKPWFEKKENKEKSYGFDPVNVATQQRMQA